MSEDVDVDLREQTFHNAVREVIIFLLLFILLYVSSYVVLCYFKRKTDNDEMYAGEEDAIVFRISLWLCTFTLAVSAGAVLLLPISIVSNEVLLLYPKSYYVKWLNSSLIHGLWNHVFLFSNLTLFIFMPFGYLFTESEGFVGSRKGLLGRVYETIIILCLLTIVVIGLAWVATAMFNEDDHSKETLFDVWNIYLPYLYSFISFLGVIVLLLCTPNGFAILFTVIGQLVVKPQFLRDIEDDLYAVQLQEEDIRRRINLGNHMHVPGKIANGHTSSDLLQQQLLDVQNTLSGLEKKKKVSPWRRNLGYPLVMLLLLVLTVLCLLMVAHNFFELLVGIKALPVGAKETVVLGISSLSTLGSVGATLEIVLILYVMCASVVGFYSLPFFKRLRPVPHDTSMVKIIGNCVVLLILSSALPILSRMLALPILSRMLGLTNFNLIGNFGSMEWLGNLYIILACDALFAALTTLCLTDKFTVKVRTEIYNRFLMLFQRDSRRTWSFSSYINTGMKDE
ncbi:Limb region 1 protein,Limb region 1 homolog-like protein,Limb region 1 protein homolog,Protein LMBR1L,Protein Lilipod [Mytilus coruscus]|uniref:Limb region 1 protein,Limb region 1 homolog-like protein,Limb region 1 protein homolog,Protein LMBR1L,Protein Lilipod n=1 Tax=Mytilus coruscus TaxID=42192 RepID=A0A6J8B8R1_MYTCO|nr:Limb region 1 protein,Limb region 1 homolog-like protein,Limb region 1 protein homolog,Protein LMBR1L,Protein Lilipod [Mytilus coruscus]